MVLRSKIRRAHLQSHFVFFEKKKWQNQVYQHCWLEPVCTTQKLLKTHSLQNGEVNTWIWILLHELQQKDDMTKWQACGHAIWQNFKIWAEVAEQGILALLIASGPLGKVAENWLNLNQILPFIWLSNQFRQFWTKSQYIPLNKTLQLYNQWP